MLHFTNAYEVGDEIVLDGFFEDDPSPLDTGGTKWDKLFRFLALDRMQARLHRWRFNLVTGAVSEEQLSESITEFGTINPTTRPPTTATPMPPPAGPAGSCSTAWSNTTCSPGPRRAISFGDGVYGSETAMAPRVGATAEDDGYLVTLTTDMNADASYCLVFDAARVGDGPVCKLQLPERISSGTHSTWAPGVRVAALGQRGLGRASAIGIVTCATSTSRRTTHWPPRLASIGAIRFARRSSNFEETVRFYRELVGLPLYETFEDSYGSNGAIFGLPSWNLTMEIVESVDAVAVDHHEQLCLYFPDPQAQQAAIARLQPAGIEPVDQHPVLGGDGCGHLSRPRWPRNRVRALRIRRQRTRQQRRLGEARVPVGLTAQRPDRPEANAAITAAIEHTTAQTAATAPT